MPPNSAFILAEGGEVRGQRRERDFTAEEHLAGNSRIPCSSVREKRRRIGELRSRGLSARGGTDYYRLPLRIRGGRTPRRRRKDAETTPSSKKGWGESLAREALHQKRRRTFRSDGKALNLRGDAHDKEKAGGGAPLLSQKKRDFTIPFSRKRGRKP